MVYEKIPEKEYQNIVEKMPFCCVDLIVCLNNKVLLIKRRNKPAQNEFWVPGGRILKRETLQQAVHRKAEQELGVKIKIERKLGCYETMFDDGVFDDLKTGTHTINVVYLVTPLSSEFSLDKTSSEFKWIDKINNSSSPYIKQILKDSNIF
jgi:colanic acid biosynthesis protein WcaH